MKRLVFCSILMIVVSMKSYSQTDTTKGISFEHNVSWQEVLQKAKKEKKYVFVDCYATWCGPCKMMDKKVYPVDSVGTLMNEKFISIKIQMDSAKQDNDETRQLYTTARYIDAKYHLVGYPSYLFFSPEGEAVHKDMGEKNIKDFLSMALAAMNPQLQYYTLLTNYRKGNNDYSLMPTLADAARRVGQDSMAGHVAHDYMNQFLATLAEEQLWTRENILFVNRYSEAVSIKDKIVQLYYRDMIKIDSVMNEKRFSAGFINYILYRDEVRPQVERGLRMNSDPNWRRLERTIEKDYDAHYVKKDILAGQVKYYKEKKQWASYIKYYIREQEMNGIENLKPSVDNSAALNNGAYEVFQYSTNKRELEKALSWVNQALTMVVSIPYLKAQDMDTKANLLYKLGKKSEGLSLEEQSHTLFPRDKEIATNYEKMKSGLPTWPTE